MLVGAALVVGASPEVEAEVVLSPLSPQASPIHGGVCNTTCSARRGAAACLLSLRGGGAARVSR